MNRQAEKFSLPVRSRMQGVMWFMAVLGIGVGILTWLAPLFLPFSNSSSPPTLADKFAEFLVVSLSGGFYFFCGGYFALRLCDEIIADENGLRWRSLRNRQSITWPQIRDYYQPEFHRRNAEIETESGNFKFDLAMMTNAATLRAAIEKHATNARTSQWEVLGLRPELDWPRTFEYKPEKHRRSSIVSVIFAVLWVAGFVCAAWSVRDGFADIWKYSGPAFSFLGLLIFGLTISIGPMFAWIVIATQRETMMRRAQNIRVSTSGLLYQNGAEHIEDAWNEVLDYYRDPMAFWSAADDRFVVITPRGEWDFTLIEDRFLLQEIIKRNATNAKYSHWREYHPDREALAAQGERVFTYRTRELRPFAIGVVPMIMTLIVLGFFLPTDETSRQTPADRSSFLIIMLPYALIAAIFCWTYLVGEIRIVDRGIRQRGILGKKFLTWNEIKQLHRRWSGAYEIVGEKTHIRFRPSIADTKILRDEITRRAINAEVMPSWTQDTSRESARKSP